MRKTDEHQLPAPVRAMVAATNSGDSERFIATFAPDAVLTDGGRVFAGRDRIAEWNARENIGVGARFAVTGASTEGDRVVLRVEVSGGGYNGPGTFEIGIASGRITSLTIR